MKNRIAIYISPQTPYLVKLWFSSYRPKCSQSIRLQDEISQEGKEGSNCFMHMDKHQKCSTR